METQFGVVEKCIPMPTKPVTSPATEFFPLHQAATPHAVRGGNLFHRFCKMLSESAPDLPSVLRPRPQTMKGKFPRTFHKTFGTSRRPPQTVPLPQSKEDSVSIDLSPSVFAPLSFPHCSRPASHKRRPSKATCRRTPPSPQRETGEERTRLLLSLQR